MMNSLAELFRTIGRAFVWYFTVEPWEMAIRTRFGPRIAVIGPGFHFKIPFVDRVAKQSVRRRTTNLHARTMTTADRKVFVVGAQLTYRIADIEKLYNTLHHAESTLQNDAATALAQWFATHDGSVCTPMAAAAGVASEITERFSGYGLADVELRIDELMAVPFALRVVTGMGDRYPIGDNLSTTIVNGNPS